jgi:hypothetical protein
MNEQEQALSVQFEQPSKNLEEFLKSSEGKSNQRNELVHKLASDHRQGKISYAHFAEMIEAAIEEEKVLLSWLGRIREEWCEIQQLCRKELKESNGGPFPKA